MIKGIGVDAIAIHRFVYWHTYSRKKLSRIFSATEIDYCLSQKNKSAERFAVRFAAREAFFKALSAAYPQHSFPFLTVCAYLSVEKRDGCPYFVFDWSCLQTMGIQEVLPAIIHVSLTHTESIAIAYVIIEDERL
jgi:holo-[acyl-carrier protein] synthase